MNTTPLRYWLVSAGLSVALGLSAYAADKPLSVHCIKGLWHGTYRLDEAIARLGVSQVSDSWHISRWGFGLPGTWESPFSSDVEAFPSTPYDLARHELVIVCNINGSALIKSGIASKLQAYAQQGGTVLFLGGRYAFGKDYHLSPLEEMAPVLFTDHFDLEQATNGLSLKAPPGTPEVIQKLAWTQSPRVYWHHQLQFKPGAKVLLEADGKPMLIAAAYGQGTVLVFAGSVMGDPPTGQTAFWDWPDWPRLLALLLNEPVRTSAATAYGTAGAAAEKKATQLAESATGGKSIGSGISPLLSYCARPVLLAKLLEAVIASDKDIDVASVDQIADTSFPWLGPSHSGQAQELLNSGLPNKGCLGLRILGASHAATALPTLQRAWLSGSLKEPDENLMAEPGELLNEQAVRDAALVAFGDLGNAEALKILKAATANFIKGAYPPASSPSSLSAENRRYQKVMLARLRCGDEMAAGPVIDFIMENLYIISRGRTWETSIPDYTVEARQQLPATKAWQDNLLAKLPLLPDSVLPAVAKRIAAEKDSRITPIALRCFAGKPLSVATKAILATSKVPAIAALSE